MNAERLDKMTAELLDVLRAMANEFDDYHYNGCPAGDLATGTCDCFAGTLIERAKNTIVKAERGQ